MKIMRCVVALVATVSLAAGVACGSSSKNYDGDAAYAVAQYFNEEAAGGKLPEGVDVTAVGSQQVKRLDKQSGQSARYCVEYEYSLGHSPFTNYSRVYVASLSNGTWTVENVKPDGDCDGVA
jgi:hypothetical protein